MKIVRAEGLGGIYRGVGATVAKQGHYYTMTCYAAYATVSDPNKSGDDMVL